MRISTYHYEMQQILVKKVEERKVAIFKGISITT